ncbi:acetylglutamate kinase [Peribacillus cavernae]|uniref:Acetylglutamate kinase n=1 Tax=Peribacillus cavernae TaxID=1674310 RepID=A0A433HNX1_9BACI|nr:acetylglutamate kinase [Peribacillus cavernae]MDQ0217545.1 acetylglutamate kinase [Peribacillus cavernae]RUQ30019.1 acetylglutamate kinase [Peribacillus cavernae]
MKILVIKCGGSIIEELSPSFFTSIKELQSQGYQLVFVHGGGPDINAMLNKYEIEPVFVNGLRKTTAEVLNIVELMLSGKSNRDLVHKLEGNGIKAVGLNGSDGKLLTGVFIDEEALGAVGEIKEVNTELLKLLLENGVCPVLTPISITESGRKLNVNADMAAGAVAKALNAEMCLFATDVNGVLKDGQILEELTETQIQHLISEGSIYGGMIPKVNTALSVLNKGINEVMIVSGKERFFNNGQFIGTKLVSEEEVLQ